MHSWSSKINNISRPNKPSKQQIKVIDAIRILYLFTILILFDEATDKDTLLLEPTNNLTWKTNNKNTLILQQ